MTTADNITDVTQNGQGGTVVHLSARTGQAPAGDARSAGLRPEIDITHEDQAIQAVNHAINHLLPGLYSKEGRPVEVAEIMRKTGTELVIPEVGPARVRRLLSGHTSCFRWKSDGKDKEPKQSPGSPGVSTVQAALSDLHWPGLRTLVGVTRMPIVRTDGTVLTTRGYDEATQLYYWPAFNVPDVPAEPNADECREARRFILDYLLRDVCWDKPASRANYLAMLFTPLLRLYIGGLLPFGVITASTAGSGKSMLTEIIKTLFGMHPTTWTRSEEEFDKRVTGYLNGTKPVVCFDNVPDGEEIKLANLAALLTLPDYGGRTLGTNDIPTGVNDKLWLATGNNLVIGGDIPSRAVLIRLDPRMENPEERDGFAIEGDIWQWLQREPNQVRTMHSLLVLTRAWIARGAPRDTSQRMRNFTEWAQIMGGLVGWLGLPDFLANAQEMKSGNDEKNTMMRFLMKWHEKYGTEWKSTRELLASSEIQGSNWGGQAHDPWDGEFLTKEVSGGKVVQYTSRGLGKYLDARNGKIFGGYRLCKSQTPTNGTFHWRVEPPEESQQ